jgi:hypothetical protein
MTKCTGDRQIDIHVNKEQAYIHTTDLHETDRSQANDLSHRQGINQTNERQPGKKASWQVSMHDGMDAVW